MATIFDNFQHTLTMVVIECANCGILFGVTRTEQNRLRDTHEGFHCPKGHNNYYSGDNATEKLKKELESANNRISSLHNTLTYRNDEIQKLSYSNRALKAAKTKVMNRVKRGVCPCCNRSFQNLQQHFKTVHPEIVDNAN